MLAEDHSKDVFTFWRYHNQCRIHNPLEVFSDGEDLVAYLANTRATPALLLLDLKMPRMGGLQVLEHLKASSHRGFTKVILTETHDLNLVANAYRLGVASFLMKPIIRVHPSLRIGGWSFSGCWSLVLGISRLA